MAVKTASELNFEAARKLIQMVHPRDRRLHHSQNGDWPALLLLESAGRVVKVVPLWHYDLSTEITKDLIAEHVLPSIIRREGTRRVGLVLHVQQVVEGAGKRTPRQEFVTLVIVDPDHCETWFAPVERRAKRGPRLGGWRCSEVSEGRFIEPLRRAVCTQG